MRFLGQINQKPAGDADLRGESSTLGPDRVLDDLDQQPLSVLEDSLDWLVLVVILALRPDVGNVQESSAVKTNLDERRLHAGKHPVDLPEVDISDNAAAAAALDMQFLGNTLLHDRDPRLLRRDIDQNLFVHSS